MNDILGRAPSPYIGAFAADASSLIFNGQNGAGLLIQQVQIGYEQPVNPLFEVGSNNRYYVVGRTMGNMSMDRVYGPSGLNDTILQQLGNVCAPGQKTLKLSLGSSSCTQTAGGTVGNPAVALIANACVARGVNYRTESQQMLLNEQVQIIFGQLSRAGGANGALAAAGGGALAGALAG